MFLKQVRSRYVVRQKLLRFYLSCNDLYHKDERINLFSGRGVMPSVKLALDHVNEHSAILRNYRLHMWWNDTMVSPNKNFTHYSVI